jgi:TetR/AcrR family transcriptional regulator, cholesterol catabolism regulator
VARASGRGRRRQILAAATAEFGANGYEATNWADIAATVGIGPTALYHYFDSKLHCLYVILADAHENLYAGFQRVAGDHVDFLSALVLALRSGYRLSEHDALRNRLVFAEQGLLDHRPRSAREEEARRLALARMRDLEFAWAAFLTRGMEQGHIPEADARLLARAVLGLYGSVWEWYRPNGQTTLEQIADSFVRRQLAVLSLPPDLADDPSAGPTAAATGPRSDGRSER